MNHPHYSLDTETPLFRPGNMAPEIVCGSVAQLDGGAIVGQLLRGGDVVATFLELLKSGHTVAFANAAYDLAVALSAISAQGSHPLRRIIFDALRAGRVYDDLLAQSLDAIYRGTLGETPEGNPLVDPSTGKTSKRYSLAIVTQIVLGRADAKEADAWRKTYAVLAGIPIERWPSVAREYPVHDARNTLEVGVAQAVGTPGAHLWEPVPQVPGLPLHHVVGCIYCGRTVDERECDQISPQCAAAPANCYQNLVDLPAQVEAAHALHLGVCWSLRTDPVKVERLAVEVDAKHAVFVERFQKKGWFRAPCAAKCGACATCKEAGSEDQAAVKRAIARAYGAEAPCLRCRGTGRVRNTEFVPCRGEKVRGRYRGCGGLECATCGGTGEVEKIGNEVTCKDVVDENGAVAASGCDGSGFDLSTIPMLPRTEKGGVSTDRDTTMESGDEDLSDFGENEFEKSRTTYVPWLRAGVDRPLKYAVNAIVGTGRCSYEGGPFHQLPRAGKERECIRARGAWCDHPVEMVLGATDYEAGELCCLAQYTYWLFGHSQMRDAINRSGKPGILHSDLAAEVLGFSLDEFLARLKAKDKQAKDFRQMCKPINFGVPGRMGVPKLVLTSRKKNAGFTFAEDGPAEFEGKPGYWGVRFCLLTGGAKRCGVNGDGVSNKVMEWKKYPCPPVCAECLKVVDGVLKPAYFRRYPEIKDFFKWGEKRHQRGEPCPSVVWDAARGEKRVTRLRMCEEISAFLNNCFQSMLADVGKHALCRMTREAYLGEREDGSWTPLLGARFPVFMHDEPLSELVLETAHLSGPRIAEIQMESGQALAPDVVWKAETALSPYLAKGMEPVYLCPGCDARDDARRCGKCGVDGKLVPWEPKGGWV